MTTKKQILTNIEILTQQTDRVFLHSALKAMKKAALLEKLKIIESILLEQRKFDTIIAHGEYTQHDLFSIAVNGPGDVIEQEILALCQKIDTLVEDFEVT